MLRGKLREEKEKSQKLTEKNGELEQLLSLSSGEGGGDGGLEVVKLKKALGKVQDELNVSFFYY